MKCKFILITLFFVFSFNFVSCDQKEEVNCLIFDNLLVLGAGSNMGANYKINIFKTLRPYAKKIYVCELENNDLIPILLDNGLVDEYLVVTNSNSKFNSAEIINQLSKSNVKIDCVVTYREEWLETRVFVASHYNLPHPSLEAIRKSQDKYITKKILEKKGIQHLYFKSSRIENLSEVASDFGFPFFIRPIKGIRSEWSRWISNQNDLCEYVADIHKHHVLKKEFILEEAIGGHEVDVDLVLFENDLLYAVVSDNFPVYKPFALETGHLMPSILNSEIQENIINLAYRAVRACGHDRGVFHIELILKDNKEIILIEINSRLGGMYIADWHKEIWGCDLIKAELAISAGLNPSPFLGKQKNRKALALICVTTNQNDIFERGQPLEVKNWLNIEEFQMNKDIYCAESWIHFPSVKETCLNGHPNIGGITIESESPILALEKLKSICAIHKPIISTNRGVVYSPDTILKDFYSKFVFDQKIFSKQEIMKKGAFLYGQDIVSNLLIPNIENIKTPTHFCFPLHHNINKENILKEIVSSMRLHNNTFHRPFAVKYSLRGDDAFTYSRRRGSNSSRGRKINPENLSNKEILLEIEQFVEAAPTNCSNIVFQELINQDRGCLFHAELSPESTEVEILWEKSRGTARAYMFSANQKSAQVTYEEIKGSGYPKNRKLACEEITILCKKIFQLLHKEYGKIAWSIEGFWHPEDLALIIFQLRPTPKDKPVSIFRNTKNQIYSTAFSWGDYEIGPFILGEENVIPSGEIFIRKSPYNQKFLEEEVVEKLSKGKFTLLIDHFFGAILSHEKWFLPEIDLRTNFGFIYVPENIFKENLGKKVKFLSCGRRGYIISCD